MEVGQQIQSLLCSYPTLSPLLASPAFPSLLFNSNAYPARCSSDYGSQGQAQVPSDVVCLSPPTRPPRHSQHCSPSGGLTESPKASEWHQKGL